MEKFSRSQEPAAKKHFFGKALVLGLALFASVVVPRLTETSVTAEPPPDNLILINPSFEVDAGGNGFAEGWFEYINIGSANLSSAEAFEGAHS